MCFTEGATLFLGKPSDKTTKSYTYENSDFAEMTAFNACKIAIRERMKYENPVKHHALSVLDRLA